ncbi:MAG TPA: TMEM43 family protein [Rhizomicrobium sp.]|nr:TMEM43 family protein [Rhizomicrobium sp.]
MPDTFTEVSSRGFFSRLGGSFLGLIAGPALVIGAIVLLWWNEGRAVEAIVGLNSAAANVVEASASAPSPANAGKLVHVIGQVNAPQAVSDSDLSLEFPGQVSVMRTAEMYQWKETEKSHTEDQLGGSQKTTTTYTYSKEWSADAIDSSEFKHPEGHENPSKSLASQRLNADDTTLGGYKLGADTLDLVDPDTVLKPEAPDGWTRSGDAYYNASAQQPKVGDLRVSYRGLKSGTTLSILAAQSGDSFAAYVAPNGYQVHAAAIGNQTAAQMIAEKRSEESFLTWILRLVGLIVVWAGLAWFLSPLSTLASVLPFLGSIVRGAAGAVAFVVALPITLVVIALAWLAHRPLIGGGLLIVAAGAGYALWRWHKGRTTPAPAAKAPAHA